MKSLGKKGFTLIELLAVITIMGILMLVAIPAVSRTIENSRRDTFADLGKTYINSIRNAVIADELKCGDSNISVGATPEGTYYFTIDTSDSTGQTNDLMEKTGKSPWGSNNVKGYVKWKKDASNGNEGFKTEYYIYLIDTANHGLTETKEDSITRTSVKTKAGVDSIATAPTDTGATECTLK